MIKKLFIAFIVLLLFAGCQRELYFPEAISAGTLKNSNGDCLPSALHGTYKANVNTTNDNYLQVTADITAAGTYVIASDTVNGYYFYSKGKFTKTGLDTISLACFGKPLANSKDTFTVRYNNSSCRFPVIIDAGTTGGGGGSGSGGGGGTDIDAAEYTLAGDAQGACANIELAGNYVAEYALAGFTHTAKVNVLVTKTGNYTISTATVDGIKFSASGTFTALGQQTVYLKGSGTPALGGTFTFAATGSSNTCSFDITIAEHSTFSFSGSPGNCLNIDVQGIYKVGTALDNSNKAVLEVNVQSTGAYIISTDVRNGFSFSASGTFTATGIQYVTMQATPSDPLAAGSFSFTPQPNISTCRFYVNVVP